MRTTLTLEPDVFQAAKQLAAAQSKSMGAVVSELVRKSLKGPESSLAQRNGFAVFQVPANARPFGLEEIKRAEEEDDEHYASQFARR